MNVANNQNGDHDCVKLPNVLNVQKKVPLEIKVPNKLPTIWKSLVKSKKFPTTSKFLGTSKIKANKY